MATSRARRSNVQALGFGGEKRIERPQCLVRATRPEEQRGGETSEPKLDLAGSPVVLQGSLGCLPPLLEPAAEIRDIAQREPDACEPGVVFCDLQHRQSRSCEPLELVDGRVVRELHARSRGRDEGERRARVVARLTSSRGRLLGDCASSPSYRLRVREIELEVNVDAERPKQLERTLEQRTGRTSVASPKGAATSGSQLLAGPLRESWVGLPELGLVPRGLLEVVSDDLVQLDQVSAVLRQPGGEALVQLGSHHLWEGVVGSIPDQQVAKAKRVVSGELCRVRADELLPNERDQAVGELRLLGSERLHRAAVEDPALDRTALEHGPLGNVELVEPGRHERLNGGRDTDLAILGIADERQHLLDEERVPFGCLHDLRQELVVNTAQLCQQ